MRFATLRNFFLFDFAPAKPDLALLVLRIGVGANLFLKHGWEKIVYFQMMGSHFMDPLHIGHFTTFLVAFTTDAIFSLLIAVGAFTRWCSLAYFGLMFGAWALRHEFIYWGNPPGAADHLRGDHGELIVVLLVAMLTLLLNGAGRFSVDAWLRKTEKA